MMRQLILATALLMAGITTAAEVAKLSASVPDVQSLLPTRGEIHVLVDDITGDGRLDLAFISHSNNSVQVYNQVAPRRFEALDQQAVTGFHPNDAIALPGSPKRYLINAEGENTLRVVKVQPDGRLS